MFLQSEEYEHMEEVVVCRKVNNYLTYLIGLTISVFILGMLTYGQKFSFRDDAFSYLGQIHTGNGNSNIIAMLIFMPGMSVGSLLCFRISSVVTSKKNIPIFRL